MKTFNEKLAVKQLESEFLSMGAIETTQKKPYVKVEILGISDKSETGLKTGDVVFIDTSLPKTTMSADGDIYIISEKALAYME